MVDTPELDFAADLELRGSKRQPWEVRCVWADAAQWMCPHRCLTYWTLTDALTFLVQAQLIKPKPPSHWHSPYFINP